MIIHTMDQRLFEASMLGDVKMLDELVKKNPLILDQVYASHSAENTPLHIAALCGHVDFFMEVFKKRPLFAKELNKDGFVPIHLATAAGHVKVVRELMEASIDQCLLKDKGGRTALHYAAIRGRVEIIEELFAKCPQVIEQETVLDESALLLAVKNCQFEAFKVLFEISEKHDDEKHEQRMKGLLDLAKATNQLQVAKFIEQKSIESNDQVVTVVDDVDHVDAPELAKSISIQQFKDAFSEFYDKDEVIPIVASLIAQVTYQAAINPPPSVWKEGMNLDTECLKLFWGKIGFHIFKPVNMLEFKKSCPAAGYYYFMAMVVIAFTTSMLAIPFQHSKGIATVLMNLCLMCMMLSVTISVLTTTSSNGFYRFVHVFISISILLLWFWCFRFSVKNHKHKKISKVQGQNREKLMGIVLLLPRHHQEGWLTRNMIHSL